MQAREVDVGEPAGLIDAKALLAATTVEELAAKADELVRSMEDPSALLAKPVSSLQEAPDLLACFGMLLSGVAPLPEDTVLDFGAGSCWTSWFLAQMGCRVVAMDVSAAMLDLGRRRFDEHPLFGARARPSFSVFDGHVMDLPDDSVDRVICFDALHHVANVADVLSEMARVLRPGGVAGFSEPGPHHSKDPQSQHEMRRYGVPECDLVLEDVWRWGQAAGFSDLSVALFSPTPQWVGFDEFRAFLAADDAAPGLLGRLAGRTLPASVAGRIGGAVARAQRAAAVADRYRRLPTARASYRHLAHVRGVLRNRRMFLLRVPGTRTVDSREATGLAVDLVVTDLQVETGPDTTVVRGVVSVRNTGRNRWLPSSAGLGAVLLGLRVGHGPHPAADHGRAALPGDGVDPGGSADIAFTTELATPRPGDEAVRLELDLVSEGITWFASVRGHPVEVAIPPAS